MRNVMSVDVEDWFCVHNLSTLIAYAEWDSYESRVEASTVRLLDLFKRHQVEATFFVLGWVAERFPDLVKEIERQGHEVATHGYSHRLLTFLEPEEFRADLQRSLEVLAKATRAVVFRNPQNSLGGRHPEGKRYSVRLVGVSGAVSSGLRHCRRQSVALPARRRGD
jgi:peptidoglycan/xylan/chitin deacetylase (PgdA/CDA1 family)